MKYMWYLFWCLYVASSALWSGPDDPSSTESEILNVESLEGRSGFFRGFMWQKQNDTFYITPVRSGPRQCLANQEEIEKYWEKVSVMIEGLKLRRENYGREGILRLRADGQWSLATEEEIEIAREENERRNAPIYRLISSEETAMTNILPRAGNLRINYRRGTVILDSIRLAGDLIVNSNRVGKKGLAFCHNFVALSCEEIPGPSISTGTGGDWTGPSERKVASSRNFHPYNGHHLIEGR